jgi:hypothetical protein
VRLEKSRDAEAERNGPREEYAGVAAREAAELGRELLDVAFAQSSGQLPHDVREAVPNPGNRIVVVLFDLVGRTLDGGSYAFRALGNLPFDALQLLHAAIA